MTRHLLRLLINHAAAIILAIGAIAAVALIVFAYRYLYQSIAQTQMLESLRAPQPIELIDRRRIESLHAFFRDNDVLPTIDPKTIRDVFSSQTPTAAPRP